MFKRLLKFPKEKLLPDRDTIDIHDTLTAIEVKNDDDTLPGSAPLSTCDENTSVDDEPKLATFGGDGDIICHDPNFMKHCSDAYLASQKEKEITKRCIRKEEEVTKRTERECDSKDTEQEQLTKREGEKQLTKREEEKQLTKREEEKTKQEQEKTRQLELQLALARLQAGQPLSADSNPLPELLHVCECH